MTAAAVTATSAQMPPPPASERTVALDELGGTLSALRLCEQEAVGRMRESLAREGQLTPLVVYASTPMGMEVVDGFKRLRAAQQLGWAWVRVRELAVSGVAAKAALMTLNGGRGLAELEEAWLVRSLYREDGLTQPQIARLLVRHKSWVSRRLLLAEGLEEQVAIDVRLGLLAAGAAAAVARLPRCNQRAVTDLVIKQGLTREQTQRVVAQTLEQPEAQRARWLSELAERVVARAGPSTERPAPPRTAAQWIIADIAAVTRLCARLQARLLEQPLGALGTAAATLCAEGLHGLGPVLRALIGTIERTTATAPHSTEKTHAPGPRAQSDTVGA
jgi:ParB-like chromosome segregation protein Spo0J